MSSFLSEASSEEQEEEVKWEGKQTTIWRKQGARNEQLVISSSSGGRMLFLTRLALGEPRIGSRRARPAAGETIWPLGSANETEPASERASAQLASM